MKASDLRERSTDDLKELERSLSDEHFQSQFKNFTNRLDDTSLIGKNRRDLARVKLILGERVRGAEPVVAEPKAAPVKKKAETKAEKPAKKKAARAETAAHAAEPAAKPSKKAAAAPAEASSDSPTAETKAEKRTKTKPKSTEKTESK
jgi:large subunit ribosomal protein L29